MATHYVRQPSHHFKKSQLAHARPGKPVRTKSSSKVVHYKEPAPEEDEDSMAVSFLNYCTVCEKQIVIPSNSVLYCSESCKKKDTEKSLTYTYDHYSPPTTPFANFTFDDFTFRDIVPQRSPTQPDSKRSSCAFSDLSSDDNTTSSEDRYHTDASSYLRKFQSAAEPIRPYRPRFNRGSTSQLSYSAAPSLSHTPASSVSYSLPYTPATTRPLPPRTKPSHSGSYPPKSIDLVTPLTAPSTPPSPKYTHKTPAISTTSTSTIEGEIVYAKSPIPEPSFASGSLGRLLASTPR